MSRDVVFTVETRFFMEKEKLDVRLSSETGITLADGRYDKFETLSETVHLTQASAKSEAELAIYFQSLLDRISRKIFSEVIVSPKTVFGAEWKK